MMLVFDKISDAFGKFITTVIGLGLLIATLIMCLNVIGRYFFGHSITFAEEMTTYMIIWITFVGSGFCVRKGIHVSVDAFIGFLPPVGKKMFIILANLIGLAFSIMLLYVGCLITAQVYRSGQISPAMQMPMMFAYGALPVGGFYMTLEYIRKLLDIFINGLEEDQNDIDSLLEKSM